MHGIQAWVGLPQELEETQPAFDHYAAGGLPVFESEGLWARLVAGEAFGTQASVKTHSPLFYVHWRLAAGARAQLEARYPERAAYIAAGTVEVEGRAHEAGRMLVFSAGEPVLFTALTPAVVMLLGGEPIGPRFVEWNFVSSSRERIEQAKSDWRAGRMKLPVHDDAEFIELPPDLPGARPAS
jgi:redox-sensitive bicupin YhaK (pirin superfamily)